jgi:hypothetical protein
MGKEKRPESGNQKAEDRKQKLEKRRCRPKGTAVRKARADATTRHKRGEKRKMPP